MTDKELIKIAEAFRRGILAGGSSVWACYIVCAPLASFLRSQGANVELVESDNEDFNHYWLRLSDGRALDPTADQFNDYQFAKFKLRLKWMPAVYLGPPTKVHAKPRLAS